MSDTSGPTQVRIQSGPAVPPASALPQPDFQSQNSFQQRLLQFTVTLAPNQAVGQPVSFAGGKNTATFEGFRSSVRIASAGSKAGVAAEFRIWGLDDSTMQQLSVLGIVFNSVQKNSITISAGNPNSGFTPVFGGTIGNSMPDYNQAPDVPFIGMARSGYINQVVPIAASSFPQTTDVATMMAGFAAQIPVAFENNGVSVQMPPSYFGGTLLQQIDRCAKAAHIVYQFVNGDSKLAIWPIGGSRTSITTIPLISGSTGMIGSPTLSPNGYMIVRSLFNPQVALGTKIKVQSDRVPQANKTWVVQKLDLELDSLIPKGQWRQIMFLYPGEFGAPPPPSGN